MKKKIAIIYTSFLRDQLRHRTTDAIFKHWNDDYFLLQGIQTPDNRQEIVTYNQNYCVWSLPFDCGLSYSRNLLVQCAAELGIEYCLITQDSIEFTGKYNFAPVMHFLEADPRHGIVGFEVDGITGWEWNIDLAPGKYFVFTKPTDCIKHGAALYTRCDMVLNFFLAKTQCLLESPWDNDLKLLEHEDFFYQLKLGGKWQVFHYNGIRAKHHRVIDADYLLYRERALHEFRDKVRAKYDLQEGYIKDRW